MRFGLKEIFFFQGLNCKYLKFGEKEELVEKLEQRREDGEEEMEKRRWRRMDGENKIRIENGRWRREDEEEWMKKIR